MIRRYADTPYIVICQLKQSNAITEKPTLVSYCREYSFKCVETVILSLFWGNSRNCWWIESIYVFYQGVEHSIHRSYGDVFLSYCMMKWGHYRFILIFICVFCSEKTLIFMPKQLPNREIISFCIIFGWN